MPCWSKSKLKKSTKAKKHREQKSLERTTYQTIQESGTIELEHNAQEHLAQEDQENGTSSEEDPRNYLPSFRGLHLSYADEITLYHYTSATGYYAIMASGVVLRGPGVCGTGMGYKLLWDN